MSLHKVVVEIAIRHTNQSSCGESAEVLLRAINPYDVITHDYR